MPTSSRSRCCRCSSKARKKDAAGRKPAAAHAIGAHIRHPAVAGVAASREATIHPGAARYRQASREALPARDTEIAAFGAINRMLDSAQDEPDRIRALGRNHDLWSMLVKDLALDTNRLPDAIKGNLLSLGLWSMRYSTLAILQKLPVEPLVEINRNIAEGLTLQAALAQTAPLASPATA